MPAGLRGAAENRDVNAQHRLASYPAPLATFLSIALTWIKVLRRFLFRSGLLAKIRPRVIRNILVPLITRLPSEALLEAAPSMAKRLDGHIRALYILPNPDTAFAYLPDVFLAACVTRHAIERETQEAVAAAKDRFIDWRSRNNSQNRPADVSIAANLRARQH